MIVEFSSEDGVPLRDVERYASDSGCVTDGLCHGRAAHEFSSGASSNTVAASRQAR